jgi:CheY-like chemotaxis protein
VCYSACFSTRTCDLQQDTRDCSRGFLPWAKVDDPACEASKVAQNSIYAIQKSSCEVSTSVERSQCEAQKAECVSVANACSSVLLGNARNIKGKVILWVDDHPDNNIYQQQALSDVGARLILARTTTEALSEMKRTHVDLVISDFDRADDPNAAYTLLAELRKFRNPPPLIIFSGSTTPQFAAEARRKGVLGETNETSKLFAMVSQSVKKTKLH